MTAWVVRISTGTGPPPGDHVVVDWDGRTGVLLSSSRRRPRLPSGYVYIGDAHDDSTTARLENIANRSEEPPMEPV